MHGRRMGRKAALRLSRLNTGQGQGTEARNGIGCRNNAALGRPQRVIPQRETGGKTATEGIARPRYIHNRAGHDLDLVQCLSGFLPDQHAFLTHFEHNDRSRKIDETAESAQRIIVAHEVRQFRTAWQEGIYLCRQCPQALAIINDIILVRIERDDSVRSEMPHLLHNSLRRLKRHGRHMYDRRWLAFQPQGGKIRRLHRDLARALARRAIDPVPLPVGLVDHPVAHGRAGNIYDAGGRDAEGLQRVAVLAREILSAPRHYTHSGLPDAGAQGSIDAVASHTAHLCRPIRQHDIIDGQISYNYYPWVSRGCCPRLTRSMRLVHFQCHISYSGGISRYDRLRSTP